MIRNDCSMLDTVLARADAADAALSEHVANCAICRTALDADQWMKALAAETRVPVLPDAGRIWLKATILRARTSAEEATRPIDLVQKLTYSMLLASWVAAGLWQLPRLITWYDTIRASHLVPTGAAAFPFSPGVIWGLAGLALITITMSIHAVLQQD